MKIDQECLGSFIISSETNMQLLFDMGKEALWAQDNESALEAALLWQAMFLNLKPALNGPALMNIVMPNVLACVI
jgi:hypothetical protein